MGSTTIRYQTSGGLVVAGTLPQTGVVSGGTSDPGGGITQSQADARYVQKMQINAANGVPGLDANTSINENQLPLPPITLTVLLANKLA